MRELQIINKKNPWPKGWGQKTSIMGVINLTPDSFSDGGELNSSKKVLDQVNHFLSNGVDVIDLGAQSTRPGAEEVGSNICLLYTSPSPRDLSTSRMPSSA